MSRPWPALSCSSKKENSFRKNDRASHFSCSMPFCFVSATNAVSINCQVSCSNWIINGKCAGGINTFIVFCFSRND